jgi:hypothetical protein
MQVPVISMSSLGPNLELLVDIPKDLFADEHDSRWRLVDKEKITENRLYRDAQRRNNVSKYTWSNTNGDQHDCSAWANIFSSDWWFDSSTIVDIPVAVDHSARV